MKLTKRRKVAFIELITMYWFLGPSGLSGLARCSSLKFARSESFLKHYQNNALKY